MIKIENYEEKVYECKNFQYPYIEIKKYDNTYTLNFQNKNRNTEKHERYQNNIPEDMQKIFNLNYNESLHGLLTEITCIHTLTN